MVSNAGAPVKIFLENIASECAADLAAAATTTATSHRRQIPPLPLSIIHSPDTLNVPSLRCYQSKSLQLVCVAGGWILWRKGSDSSRVKPTVSVHVHLAYS